jgi:hypothetical protein
MNGTSWMERVQAVFKQVGQALPDNLPPKQAASRSGSA